MINIGTVNTRLRLLLIPALLALTFLVFTSALAFEETPDEIDWTHMAMILFGGLALFLFGMEQMSGALKSALGHQMKALEITIQVVRDLDERAASEVLTMKSDIDHLLHQALQIQSEVLADVDAKKIEEIRMEMTAMENLKRIYTYLKRIAREVVPLEVRV